MKYNTDLHVWLLKVFFKTFPIVEIPASDLLPPGSDDGKVDEMENMVSELTEISDSVHFTPSDIEPDSDGEFESSLLF